MFDEEMIEDEGLDNAIEHKINNVQRYLQNNIDMHKNIKTKLIKHLNAKVLPIDVNELEVLCVHCYDTIKTVDADQHSLVCNNLQPLTKKDASEFHLTNLN